MPFVPPKCGDCKYWEKIKQGPVGYCHFDPPIAMVRMDNQFAKLNHPECFITDWCSHWVAMPLANE